MKRSDSTGHWRPYTLDDYVRLYDWDWLNVDGITQMGMFKGLPWWYAWFIGDHPIDSRIDEGHEVYVINDAERAAFPELKDARSVTLNTIDHRLRKGGIGFTFEVIKVTLSSEPCEEVEGTPNEEDVQGDVEVGL